MIESKVKTATLSAAVSGAILWGIAWALHVDVSDIPAPLAVLVAAVVPGALTLAGGYFARHTYRPRPPAPATLSSPGAAQVITPVPDRNADEDGGLAEGDPLPDAGGDRTV